MNARSTVEKIGLIGGTGVEGRGIALRLAMAGFQVQIGSRSQARARSTAVEMNRQIGSRPIGGAENREVIENCSLLFLTVPFRHAAETLKEHESQFTSDQVLIDVTVPVLFEKGPRFLSLEEGSGSEHLRSRLRSEVPLVATFKTIPAELLSELDAPLECDEFICSDSSEARERVLRVLQRIEGVRWLDGGPLRFCRSLEGMTLLAIGMNRRYRVKGSRFKVVGI